MSPVTNPIAGPAGPPGPGLARVIVQTGTGDDDLAIENAIAAAAAIGPATQVLFKDATYSIANFHRFTTTPPLSLTGRTTIQATAAGAGIAIGAALPAAPTNIGDNARAGGFTFDGGGIALQGVFTNVVGWHFEPIIVQNLAAGADGFGVCGQNNNYYRLESDVLDPGFCLWFDNGAGGNRIFGYRLGGGNHVDFRETVGLNGYGVPTDNILYGGVLDQPTTGSYSIRQRAGAQNVFVDTTGVHRVAAALVKFEPNTGGYTGGAFVCGRLIFRGRTKFAGNADGGPQFAFWADFVTAGVAGPMIGDVALDIEGIFSIAGVGGEFQWGCTTPVGGHCNLLRYPAATARPLWTPVGTGAQTGPVGIWRMDAKTGINGFPTSTERLQVYGDSRLQLNAASAVLRSNDPGLNSWLSIGRTSEDGQLGVAGGPNNMFQGTAQGDLGLRQEQLAKALHIGVDNGGGNIGNAAAELVLRDGVVTFNKSAPAAAGDAISLADLQTYLAAAKRELPSEWGLGLVIAAGSVAGSYLASGGVVGAAGSAKSAFYLDPADFPTIPGVSKKVRTRGIVETNATAPGINYNFQLCPVTGWGGAAGATPTITAIGAAVDAAPNINTPAAGGPVESQSAGASFPAAGYYVIACVLSGTQAANAVVVARASLEMFWS